MDKETFVIADEASSHFVNKPEKTRVVTLFVPEDAEEATADLTLCFRGPELTLGPSRMKRVHLTRAGMAKLLDLLSKELGD